MKPRCNMLIDQNRYISNDPVGYSCKNDAVREDSDGYLYCESCLDLIQSAPHRVTKPKIPFTTKQQIETHERIQHYIRNQGH